MYIVKNNQFEKTFDSLEEASRFYYSSESQIAGLEIFESDGFGNMRMLSENELPRPQAVEKPAQPAPKITPQPAPQQQTNETEKPLPKKSSNMLRNIIIGIMVLIVLFFTFFVVGPLFMDFYRTFMNL